jgi:WD40 repeat protein
MRAFENRRMCPHRTRLLLTVGLALVVGPSLGAEPPARQPVRTDHYGDPLPPGARFRLGTIRLRHDGEALRVAWAPDGKTLMSSGTDGTVRLWQIPGGKHLARLETKGEVVFAPDGRTMACGWDDGWVRLCDLPSGKERRHLRVPSTDYDGFFSPDGKILVSFASPAELHLYDAETGKAIRVIKSGLKSIQPPTDAVFSADGRTLALVNGSGGIDCWDVATGEKVRTLRGKEIYALAFSPDGKMLAALAATDGPQASLTIWSWPAGKQLRRLDPTDHEPEGLLFSPDGRTLALVSGGGLSLWDPAAGKELRRVTRSCPSAFNLAFSPDGSLIAAARPDGTVTLWEVNLHKSPRPLTGRGHCLTSVALTTSGQLVTSAQDGTLALWDARDGRHLRTLDRWEHHAGVFAAAPDGSRVLGFSSLENQSAWWDVAAGRRLPLPSGLPERITCATFSPDNTMLALGDFDGRVQLRGAANGELRRQIRVMEEGEVPDLHWSPDGRTLAVSDADGRLGLWDWRAGRLRRRLGRPRRDDLPAVAFSADGRFLAAVWRDGGIHLYEVVSGQEVRQIRGAPSSYALAFAPDGRTLASGSRPNLDDNTNVRPLTFDNPEAAVRLWDVFSGKQVHLLAGHQLWVHTVAFSPDGATLVSCSYDDTVLSWDVAAVTSRRPAGPELPAARLAALWGDLADEDAARAQRAVGELLQSPGSALPFLEKALPPVPPARMARVAALIADVDHEDFRRREWASQELEKIGEAARPAIRKALADRPSLEARRRLESLLEALDARPPSREWLRTLRALQVLEGAGTPQARRVLEALARGAPEAGLTQEAKAALERLAARQTQRR